MKAPKSQQSLDEFFKQRLENHQEPDLSALQDAMWQSVRPSTNAVQVITKYFIFSKKALFIVGGSAVLFGSCLLAYKLTKDDKMANLDSFKDNAVAIEKPKLNNNASNTVNTPIKQFEVNKNESEIKKSTVIPIPEQKKDEPNTTIAPIITEKKDSVIIQKDTASVSSIAALQDSVNSSKAKKRIIVKRKVVVNDSVVKYQKRW